MQTHMVQSHGISYGRRAVKLKRQLNRREPRELVLKILARIYSVRQVCSPRRSLSHSFSLAMARTKECEYSCSRSPQM